MQNAAPNAPKENGKTPAGASEIQKIAQHMARLNVPSIPRNYELFHEALFAPNAELAREIAALGPHPGQAMLDELGLKHRLVTHCGLVTDKSQSEAVQVLRNISDQLADGLTQKQTFVRAVESVAHSMAEDQNQSLATFVAEMEFLNASITQLLLAETELASTLREEAEKLDTLEKDVAAVQAETLSDRVTGLPNRIAFTNQLMSLYESADGFSSTAMMLVGIDDFESFNKKFGGQVSSHMLRKLGGLFRKSIKKNDFVARLEGDAFALLFSNVGTHDAKAIAERLRSSVSDSLVYATSDKADPGKLTISIGVVMSADAHSPGQLQSRAEAALIAARSNRRQPIQFFVR